MLRPFAAALGCAVVGVVLGAAPARPCTLPPDPVVSDFLVVGQGDTLPTNPALVVLPENLGSWSAVIVRDDGVDPGETFAFDGNAGVDGFLDLDADAAWVATINDPSGASRAVRFQTGAGADDDAPGPPDVDVERADAGAGIRNRCAGGVEWSNGHSVNVLRMTAGDDVRGFHVLANDDAGDLVDERFVVGDSVGFSEEGGGVWSVAVSAIDVAGNEGEATVVDVDFGGCGGCAQGSASPLGLGLLLLLLRRRRGVR